MGTIKRTPLKPKKKLTAPEFVLINRNFMHYPLVLSHLARPHFRLRKRLGGDPRLVCLRHESTRIDQGSVSLYLPYPQYRHNTARAPSRLDMDVAFRLLSLALLAKAPAIHEQASAEVRKAIDRRRKRRKLDDYEEERDNYQDERQTTEREVGQSTYKRTSEKLRRDRKTLENLTLTYRSIYALTKALGRVATKAKNRREVEHSCEFLADLRVGYFDTWFRYGKKSHKEVGFLSEFVVKQDSVHIKLDPAFAGSVPEYCEKVPLPLLTTSEAAMALDGLVRPWHKSKLRDERLKYHPRTLRAKLGLWYDNRYTLDRAVDRAVDQVNRYRTANKKRGPRIAIKAEDPFGTIVRIVRRRDMRREDLRKLDGRKRIVKAEWHKRREAYLAKQEREMYGDFGER